MKNESFSPEQIRRIVEKRMRWAYTASIIGTYFLAQFIYNSLDYPDGWESFLPALLVLGGIGLILYLETSGQYYFIRKMGANECFQYGHYLRPEWCNEEAFSTQNPRTCPRCSKSVSAAEWKKLLG